MNLRAGLALLKSAWIIWLQQRSFFFLLAFGWMIPPLMSLFIWYTAASGSRIGGITQGQFVAYYLLFILVNQLTYAQTNWIVGDAIRDGGSLNVQLLRPISPLVSTVATEIAGKAVYMLFVVPVAILLALFLHPEFHFTLGNGLLFLLSFLFAWLLRFFWGYWLALLAFWATRANALLALQETLIFLLAGQVASIALLPEKIQIVAKILPFRYMVSFPVEILTNQLTSSEILNGLLYQLVWLGVALCLFVLLWRKGLMHYTAVGG